jgi:methylated-DNA-[protein]-cysteine S-methyltransferase
MRHCTVITPIGELLLLADDHARMLTGIRFDPTDVPPGSTPDDTGVLAEAARQLTEYTNNERTRFELPLETRSGAPFHRRVWELVAEIPFGATTTYGELARRIGAPNAARAVGSANGRNPFPVVIPCHRVVGSSGALTGYAGGLELKRRLLEHEGILVPVA